MKMSLRYVVVAMFLHMFATAAVARERDIMTCSSVALSPIIFFGFENTEGPIVVGRIVSYIIKTNMTEVDFQADSVLRGSLQESKLRLTVPQKEAQPVLRDLGSPWDHIPIEKDRRLLIYFAPNVIDVILVVDVTTDSSALEAAKEILRLSELRLPKDKDRLFKSLDNSSADVRMYAVRRLAKRSQEDPSLGEELVNAISNIILNPKDPRRAEIAWNLSLSFFPWYSAPHPTFNHSLVNLQIRLLADSCPAFRDLAVEKLYSEFVTSSNKVAVAQLTQEEVHMTMVGLVELKTDDEWIQRARDELLGVFREKSVR